MHLTRYERILLEGWEETYKKGQLTFWILFSLVGKGRHMNDIKDLIHQLTNKSLTADDQSMYRALRRLNDAELIEYTNVPSDNGPDLKMYSLTKTGNNVLQVFTERNISSVYYEPAVMNRLHKLQERKQ
jgi:PadR family transcriptional regulator PadR